MVTETPVTEESDQTISKEDGNNGEKLVEWCFFYHEVSITQVKTDIFWIYGTIYGCIN